MQSSYSLLKVVNIQYTYTADAPTCQQEAAVQYQQIWLPVVNRDTLIEQTDLFIFIFLFYFVHVACTTTMIAKSQRKTIAKYFLIVAIITNRYLQPFMSVTIWQPIGGFKRCCCCCDWTSSTISWLVSLFGGATWRIRLTASHDYTECSIQIVVNRRWWG